MKPGFKLLLAIPWLLFLVVNQSISQVDRTFWFAAPEVTSRHGDNPIVLRVTTFDTPSTITISIPANPAFIPVVANIQANTQFTYQFNNLNQVENRPPASILNKGILLTSTSDVSAYYEVAHGSNPDKFTLKGQNALGTEFFVPSQNAFRNRKLDPAANTPPVDRERVDIVSTQDNNQITITLKEAVVGHAANSTFTITLNRGQTYCLEAIGWQRAIHLGGTHIESTKPIAVTISDDSVTAAPDGGTNPTSYDLIGDQLIPVRLLGTEYIAVHTLFGTGITGSIQKLFVTAVENNTTVMVNGVAAATLNRGMMYELNITNNAIYIKSTKPIYAYQLTSDNRSELGSALLPAIACTGSKKVAFTKVLADNFYVQLLTQYKNINHFIMRDENNVIVNNLTGATWTKVNGTGPDNGPDTWYSTVREMTLSTGKPYSIENSFGLFHLSVFDRNGSSMSYGYFSAYSTIRIKGPTQVCKGNIIELSTEEPMKSYNWYSDKDIWNPFSTAASVQVTESGRYWVKAEVNFGGCFTTDTLNVLFKMPEFTLGKDTIVCPGESITYTINGFNNNEKFLWKPSNITANTFSINPAPGTSTEVSLTITDDLGCSSTKSVMVSGHNDVTIDWDLAGNSVCEGDIIRNTTPMKRYQWAVNGVSNPADTLNYIVATVSGNYTLTAWSEQSCTKSYSRNITVNPLPGLILNDIWVCPGQPGVFSPGAFSSYLWSNGSTSPTLTLTSPSNNIWVEVKNSFGCSKRDTAIFRWYNETVFSFGKDTSVCINDNITINIDNSFSNYSWEFSLNGTGTPVNVATGTPTYTINSADPATDQGRYLISAIDGNGCSISDDFYLTVLTVPDLTLGGDKIDICRGDTIKIETQNHSFVRYEWTTSSNPAFIGTDLFLQVSDPGIYSLTAWQANGCKNQDNINVTVIERPTFDFNDITVCPNTTLTLGITNWWSDIGTPPSKYLWSTGATNPTITSNSIGDYTVTVWDDKGCFSIKTASVNWHTIEPLNLNNASYCDNVAYNLVSPLSVPADIKEYQWSHGATSTTGPVNGNWAVTNTGSFTLTVTDNNNCVNSASLVLSHLSSPKFDLGSDREMCQGDVIKIEARPDYVRYEWNNDKSDNQPNFIFVSTNQIYKLDVWTNNGCSSSEQVNVVVSPLPAVNLGPDITVCAGVLTNLTLPNYPEILWSTGQKNITSINVADGTFTARVTDSKGCKNSGTRRISWHPVPSIDLGQDEYICPVDYPFSITAPEGFVGYQWHNGELGRTIYANLLDTVNIVRVQDTNGCWGWDSKIVTFLNDPDFSIGNDIEACEPEERILDAGIETIVSYHTFQEIRPIQSYNWNNGSTDQAITINQTGEYWVRIFDGCFFLNDTINAIFNPPPYITAIDTVYYAQVTVLADGGNQPFRYFMDDGNVQNSHIFKKVPNGNHTVWVIDSKGCMDSLSFVLDSHYELDVPNYFTPNGDGYNDRWEIKGIEELPESIISIYDRYGKLLIKYKASSPGWNGEYLNRPVPSDDYWYVIQLVPVSKILKGNITVKRE